MTITAAPKPVLAPSQNVYELIRAVSREIAKVGIAKDKSNQQQGYKFRGIDQVQNALAPLLAEYGLVIIPRILSRTCTERTTVKGGVVFSVTVEAEYDFVSALDSSSHTAKAFGEGMDSGDKGTSKALTAAYKAIAFQTFCIPTEGEPDADETTPESVIPVAPPKFETWFDALIASADGGVAKVKETWEAATEDQRAFALGYRTEVLEKARERASAVSKAKKAAAKKESPA